MINVTTAGLVATATQLAELLTIRVKLCKPKCVSASSPIVSVSYSVGTPTLNGASVFVPITATVQVSSANRCGKPTTETHVKTFTVAFQGQTALPTVIPTVTRSGMEVEWADVNCCKAKSVIIRDSVLIAIA